MPTRAPGGGQLPSAGRRLDPVPPACHHRRFTMRRRYLSCRDCYAVVIETRRLRFRLAVAWWLGRVRFSFPRWWRRRWPRVVLATFAVLLVAAVAWASSSHPGDPIERACTTAHGSRFIPCQP